MLLDIKRELGPNTIVGSFKTLLSPINGSSSQKFSKETSELSYTIDQMDLRDLHRIFHPTTAEIHSIHQHKKLFLK
jgi:hypothetical protein